LAVNIGLRLGPQMEQLRRVWTGFETGARLDRGYAASVK
jgi:hypothetical protein